MGSIAEARNKGKTVMGGRVYFATASRSNPGQFHLSNKDECSCIGGSIHKHCYHMELCKCVRCFGVGSCLWDGPEGCYWCGGTGDAQ